jgi:hypothetical protein
MAASPAVGARGGDAARPCPAAPIYLLLPSFPSLLSAAPRGKTAAAVADHGGRREKRRYRAPLRQCARPPEGERAAVEGLCGGALCTHPEAVAMPAARTPGPATRLLYSRTLAVWGGTVGGDI